jgi:hypothetical protein
MLNVPQKMRVFFSLLYAAITQAENRSANDEILMVGAYGNRMLKHPQTQQKKSKGLTKIPEKKVMD